MNRETAIAPSEKSKLSLPEDWVVVLLGFLIIFIFLLGLVLPAPVYGWSNSSELAEKVFSGENLFRIALQFFIVFIFSVLGSLLTNKPVKASLIVFPLLYIISVIALVLAGMVKLRHSIWRQ